MLRTLPWLLLLGGATACSTLGGGDPEPEQARIPEPPVQAPRGPDRTTGSTGRLLVYSAITGHVAVSQQPQVAGLSDAAREAIRAAELEAEIEEELSRTEDLSGRIENEQGSATSASGGSGQSGGPGGQGPTFAAPDPGTVDVSRVAPEAPTDRDLPLSIFDSQREVVPAGTWGNDAPVEVVRRSLDVDDDGRPEQIRWYDGSSGELIRVEQDRDYDGRMDAWSTHENGELRERLLDDSGDGRVDTWERYADGRLVERDLDRNGNGAKDAFFRYADGELVEERHDSNQDGRIDRVVTYEDMRRVRAEEDRDGDGRKETITTYQMVEGREYVARIEQYQAGSDRPQIVETYEVQDGRALLARREEDRNGNGSPDVVSIYKNGKLVAREIADPNLAPL